MLIENESLQFIFWVVAISSRDLLTGQGIIFKLSKKKPKSFEFGYFCRFVLLLSTSRAIIILN